MALDFVMNIAGNWVDGLEKGNRKLEDTEKKSHEAGEAVKFFETELGKVRAGAASLDFGALVEGGHFFQFDLAEGALIAFEAIKKVAEVIVEAGKAALELGGEFVKASAAAEDLDLAVKLTVGDEGQEQVNKLAESFKGTQFNEKFIKSALLPILEESGMKNADQWDNLVTAATDVATRKNTGQAGAVEALQALRSIDLRPEKIGGSLKALGIHSDAFYKDLADLNHMTVEAQKKALKTGHADSGQLLSVALHQIASRNKSGKLGGATNEGADTLGSQLKRLSQLKENLFEGLADSPGMHAVSGFVKNFVDVLGEEAPALIQQIGGIFEDVFGAMSGPEGMEKMREMVRSVGASVVTFIHDFRDAWPSIKEGAVEVWEVAKGIAATLLAMVRYIKESTTSALDLGHSLAGVADFLGGKSTDKYDRPRAQFGDRPGGAGEAMSPLQELFESHIPKFADGGVVDSPTVALVGEAGPEAIVPLGAGGGKTLSDFEKSSDSSSSNSARPSLTVNFGDLYFAPGTTAEDAREAARAFRVELEKAVAEVAANLGVS